MTQNFSVVIRENDCIYRVCRITQSHIRFQSVRVYLFAISIQWILSIFRMSIFLLMGDYQYLKEDYHCQILILHSLSCPLS
jgi:hypothetical protein